MHRRRVVLLGTGTGVGKTYLGQEILRAWRRAGVSTLGLKPIESGYDPAQPEGSDAGALCESAHAGAPPLYALRAPISPHLAAEREGSSIEPQKVTDWVRSQEDSFFGADPAGTGGVTLIETAGGAFSPLGRGLTNLDLAERLLPALLVLAAPDSLGVLHDVTATLRAMAPRRPDFVVLSQARPVDASSGTNGAELERVVFPALGATAPKDSEVVTLFVGDKADFVADRILRKLDAI